MNKWNKLISKKDFDLVIFEEFVEEKGVNKITQSELDRILKMFGETPFEYMFFCDVYDEVLVRKANILAINFSVIVSILVMAVTIGVLQFYLGKLRVLLSVL